jgi:cytochrome c-type biogenesis protein CcmE
MTDTVVAPAHTRSPSGAPSGPALRGRSARLRLVVCVAIVVAALGWVALRGMTGSFVYYLTPTEVTVGHQAQVDQRVRLGGYVVPGGVRRTSHSLTFTITDQQHSLQVVSTGPVPQMFRAGQGVVVEGALGTDGRFHSDTLLVKHDGDYRAPEGASRPGRG